MELNGIICNVNQLIKSNAHMNIVFRQINATDSLNIYRTGKQNTALQWLLVRPEIIKYLMTFRPWQLGTNGEYW